MELPHLKRSNEEASHLIAEQIQRAQHVYPHHLNYKDAMRLYQGWVTETYDLLLEIYDTDKYAEEYKHLANRIIVGTEDGRIWKTKFTECLDAKIRLLKEFQRRIDKELVVPGPNQIINFWPLIHPEIVTVTKTRFETNHYADCAEAAFKHVNSVIKQIVKRSIGKELDGASLMKTAFSVNNPVIEIDDITTETGRSIQQGYMEIFAGSMTGIRNPKAHAVIEIGRERAIHFIFLASLLMDTIDIAGNKYRY